jgi:hypothetical protein
LRESLGHLQFISFLTWRPARNDVTLDRSGEAVQHRRYYLSSKTLVFHKLAPIKSYAAVRSQPSGPVWVIEPVATRKAKVNAWGRNALPHFTSSPVPVNAEAGSAWSFSRRDNRHFAPVGDAKPPTAACIRTTNL